MSAPEPPRLRPIGWLETPWQTRDQCPRNGRQPDPPPLCRAHLDPEFREGLLGIEGFSHLILLYWMDQAKPVALTFTPPFATEVRGVFATRSPSRPNPIGLSVVALDGIEAPGVLKVRYLDCVSGTKLLDIKPYLPSVDAEPDARMGWLEAHRTRPKPGH